MKDHNPTQGTEVQRFHFNQQLNQQHKQPSPAMRTDKTGPTKRDKQRDPEGTQDREFATEQVAVLSLYHLKAPIGY